MYLGKWEIQLCYGGPEEGSWYYDAGEPMWKLGIPLPSFLFYPLCRFLNGRERARRDNECMYDYTSVLAYGDTYYEYGNSDTLRLRPFPEVRPHYE